MVFNGCFQIRKNELAELPSFFHWFVVLDIGILKGISNPIIIKWIKNIFKHSRVWFSSHTPLVVCNIDFPHTHSIKSINRVQQEFHKQKDLNKDTHSHTIWMIYIKGYLNSNAYVTTDLWCVSFDFI